MEKRKTWLSFYLVVSVAFTIWFLFTANIVEPWRQISHFLKTGEIIVQNFSWEMARGFVSLDLYLSVAIMIFLMLIVRKKTRSFLEKWRKLLDLSPWLLFYDVVGKVAAEEIFFRWFPLAVLLPLWQTPATMWVLIILSSLIFGALHVLNQMPGERKVIFTIPQFVGGILYCYIFLSFGFLGVMMVHLIFDLLLFSILWSTYRLNKNAFR